MSQSAPSTPPTELQTILVVDDDPSIVRLCSDMLRLEGFQVLQAQGSPEALSICTNYEEPIHLLLTDLVLSPPAFRLATDAGQFPHVHGHDLAIRAAAIRKDLRIILMSGNPDKELASHGISPGNLPFLQKPFDHQALIRLVRQVLEDPPTVLEAPTEAKKENQGKEVDWFG
ncbi:MAG: response regulator [Nitrospiraceae bacterium]